MLWRRDQESLLSERLAFHPRPHRQLLVQSTPELVARCRTVLAKLNKLREVNPPLKTRKGLFQEIPELSRASSLSFCQRNLPYFYSRLDSLLKFLGKPIIEQAQP